MNNEYTDEHALKQVDDLLGQGKPSDHALMNDLANTIPEADPDFQEQLEERLVAQLARKTPAKKEEVYMNLASFTPMTRLKSPSFPMARWVAVVVMVLAGAYLVKLYRDVDPEMAIPLPVDSRIHRIVVATKYITAEDIISNDMVDTIDLPADIFETLQYSHPGEIFYSDVSQVLGQQSTVSMNPLEPFLPSVFGIEPESCAQGSSTCAQLPDGYYAMNLPLPEMSIAGAVKVGDSVDVMFDMNNQHLSVQGVRIWRLEDDYLTVAAPGWKYALLYWYFRSKNNVYTLRHHIETTPANSDDQTLVEYTLRTLTPVDEMSHFMLFVSVPLSDFSAVNHIDAMDLVRTSFELRTDAVRFTFDHVELVRTVNESTFVVRMPQSHVNLLDSLLTMNGTLSVWQWLDDYNAPAPAAPAAAPADPCAQGVTVCVTVPESYDEITLPRPQGVVQYLKPGDYVDVSILMAGSGEYSLLVGEILLVDIQEDLITLAAPAWKHMILVWMSQQDNVYRLRSAHFKIRTARENALVVYTLEAPEPIPESYQFDLVVRIPYSQSLRLADMPYTLDDIPFTTNGDTMEFWFKNIRTISTYQNTVIVELPQSDAQTLSALMRVGADLTFQPDANPPTATPTSISGVIPQGRVAISLPIKDVPADADQMDVILSLPESNITMSAEDRAKIRDTAHFRINNGIWEFRFTDLVILEVYDEEEPDPAVDNTMVTFHVTPQDAMALQYLVEIGAEGQFASRLDETSESASIATPEGTPMPTFTPTPAGEMLAEPTASAQGQVCMEAACRKDPSYYKIKLPLSDFTLPYAVQQGERIDIVSSAPAMTVEHVILLDVNDESVTVAAPAWKYSLLLWLSQLEGPASYTMSPSDGHSEGTVVEPLAPKTMTLRTLYILPEIFNLLVKVPEEQISRLADMPYSGVRSSLNDGALEFWFPDIEMVSLNADASYIIRLPAGNAANLDYLLSLGGDMMLFTPAATPEGLPEGAAIIPQGRVGIILPATEPLPDGDTFDVFVSVATDQSAVLAGLPKTVTTVPFRRDSDVLEFHFSDVVLTGLYPPGSIDPGEFDIQNEITVASFHVSIEEATLLEYLVNNGGEVRYEAASPDP